MIHTWCVCICKQGSTVWGVRAFVWNILASNLAPTWRRNWQFRGANEGDTILLVLLLTNRLHLLLLGKISERRTTSWLQITNIKRGPHYWDEADKLAGGD